MMSGRSQRHCQSVLDVRLLQTCRQPLDVCNCRGVCSLLCRNCSRLAFRFKIKVVMSDPWHLKLIQAGVRITPRLPTETRRPLTFCSPSQLFANCCDKH